MFKYKWHLTITIKRGKMKHSKLIAASVSISLIVLLLFAGPVKAFIFDFSINNSFPLLGDIINFVVSSEIEPGEKIDIQKFELMITGPKNVSCEFYPNATLISSCPGIDLENIETTNYQYGYGFLPGFLKYNIELDTETLLLGDYIAKLTAFTPSGNFETSQQELSMVNLTSQLNQCSVRATNGETIIEGETFDARNKLSLYSSRGNSRNSKGLFTAQDRRDRISYKFIVDEARRTTGDVIYFRVHGELMINRVASQEAATIIYNTQTFELQIIGDSLNVSDMEVTFAQC